MSCSTSYSGPHDAGLSLLVVTAIFVYVVVLAHLADWVSGKFGARWFSPVVLVGIAAPLASLGLWLLSA